MLELGRRRSSRSRSGSARPPRGSGQRSSRASGLSGPAAEASIGWRSEAISSTGTSLDSDRRAITARGRATRPSLPDRAAVRALSCREDVLHDVRARSRSPPRAHRVGEERALVALRTDRIHPSSSVGILSARAGHGALWRDQRPAAAPLGNGRKSSGTRSGRPLDGASQGRAPAAGQVMPNLRPAAGLGSDGGQALAGVSRSRRSGASGCRRAAAELLGAELVAEGTRLVGAEPRSEVGARQKCGFLSGRGGA